MKMTKGREGNRRDFRKAGERRAEGEGIKKGRWRKELDF